MDPDSDPNANPDPAIFVLDLQDVNKIGNQCFSYYFLLDDRRSGSVSLT
jgi:hypothetical protein